MCTYSVTGERVSYGCVRRKRPFTASTTDEKCGRVFRRACASSTVYFGRRINTDGTELAGTIVLRVRAAETRSRPSRTKTNV